MVAGVAIDILEGEVRGVSNRHQVDHADRRMGCHAHDFLKLVPVQKLAFDAIRDACDSGRKAFAPHQADHVRCAEINRGGMAIGLHDVRFFLRRQKSHRTARQSEVTALLHKHLSLDGTSCGLPKCRKRRTLYRVTILNSERAKTPLVIGVNTAATSSKDCSFNGSKSPQRSAAGKEL